MKKERLQALLDAIAAEMMAVAEKGAVARYIPELAAIDPEQFAIALALPDGALLAAGDAETAFSIQSVSKAFTLALALEKVGVDLWRKVGREPSGDPFNSIVQLEHEGGKPRNPLINAGAIAVADALLAKHGGDRPRTLAAILGLMRKAAGDAPLAVDDAVFRSEMRTAARNRAMAHFMAAHGLIENPPEDALALYTEHCAIAMTVRELALAGRIFAHDGRLGPKGARLISRARARRVASLMLTCGHYDGSGDFAFRVGLPGKSGVGGGILAVAPGEASIAVFSPGLNAVGNSKLGSIALERLAYATGWSVFGAD